MKYLKAFNESKEIKRLKFSRGRADGGTVHMDDTSIEYFKTLKKYNIKYSDEDSHLIYLMEKGPKLTPAWQNKNKVMGIWKSKNNGRYYLSLWGGNWQEDYNGKHYRCDSLDELKEFITKVFQIK